MGVLAHRELAARPVEHALGRQCDSSARAGVRSEAVVPSRGGHARIWAIASARRDREIVSSARLILVISKRVSDLSADPPDACSRAAGQLTRRNAPLLQSPRSGTVAGGRTLAAGIAQKEKRQRDCWIAPRAATSPERCDLLPQAKQASPERGVRPACCANRQSTARRRFTTLAQRASLRATRRRAGAEQTRTHQ